MGFFEELGELMKKYNFEIHAIQLDENVKIMNERFHLGLTKEDLPPPVFIFRTNEGSFVPQVFGPISLNNEEHNIKFFNIADNSTTYLFPVKEPEPEVKVEEKKEEENITPEQEKQVVDTLNKLSEVMQMDWEETPKTEETKVTTTKATKTKKTTKAKKTTEAKLEEVKTAEKPAKKTTKKSSKKKASEVITENYLIVSNIFTDTNVLNMIDSNEFIKANKDKLVNYDTLLHFFTECTNSPREIKLNTPEGKELVKNIEAKIGTFTKVITLKNYSKSAIAKKIVKDLEAKGIGIIAEKDFK